MFVSVYLEIDNEKNPVFKEVFFKDIEKRLERKMFIVSKEYNDCLDQDLECVKVIPYEIIEQIDLRNVCVENRAVSLELQKNVELYNWLKETTALLGDEVEGYIVNGLYDFVVQVANDLDIKVVLASENINSERIDNYMNILESRNEKISEYESKMEDMQRQIDSKNEGMQRLQQKITDLSTELFKNNAEKESIDEQLQQCELRMDKSERQKVLLAELYAALLKELNETKIELLNLKHKGV